MHVVSYARDVEDLLAERGLDISYETVRPLSSGTHSQPQVELIDENVEPIDYDRVGFYGVLRYGRAGPLATSLRTAKRLD